MTSSPDRLTYLKLAAVTMIWGATFVAGRYLAADVEPMLAATLPASDGAALMRTSSIKPRKVLSLNTPPTVSGCE